MSFFCAVVYPYKYDVISFTENVSHPPGKEVQRPVAHECLGEVLRVLRQVISTYPLLNTVEILTAAGKLISRVKGVHHSQQEAALPRSWKPPPQCLIAL